MGDEGVGAREAVEGGCPGGWREGDEAGIKGVGERKARMQWERHAPRSRCSTYSLQAPHKHLTSARAVMVLLHCSSSTLPSPPTKQPLPPRTKSQANQRAHRNHSALVTLINCCILRLLQLLRRACDVCPLHAQHARMAVQLMMMGSR